MVTGSKKTIYIANTSIIARSEDTPYKTSNEISLIDRKYRPLFDEYSYLDWEVPLMYIYENTPLIAVTLIMT